ncbi:MAG TPA: magnesium-translocating P-type ATPase [Candidatus Cloacimonadota bacterium]|nr:magnesium-translocating P-type ATPase [Candidatus Cloacimonadota bacterium]HPT71181.1 magnesium-translocating P-type ATPase [Candidatus Cloacimonadota bacterium]
MNDESFPFWSIPQNEILQQLHSKQEGLTAQDARQRLIENGRNTLKKEKSHSSFKLLVSQFSSPIIIILICAAILSIFLHDTTDAIIILTIVMISGILGFWQEKGAANAVAHLLAMVRISAQVLRDGKPIDIPVEEVVPGDIVILDAGDIIPGDGLILDSQDLFIDESTLTGETFPLEKKAGELPVDTALSARTNSVWMGTHVISGDAHILIVHTGKKTEFGKVSERLQIRPEATEFEIGVRRFGYFLMEVTILLVFAIFAINVFLAKPVLDSFLFSLALAVGLTPQLLPAIISINLSHGAKNMAKEKVIVKRLSSIEDFGSMNILCSDKTGTLTEGVVTLQEASDGEGKPSEKVLLYAYLNAVNETGFTNPIDQAIRNANQFDVTSYSKISEIPYDFNRKRLSILVKKDESRIMITKGAIANILPICDKAEMNDGRIQPLSSVTSEIQRQFEIFSGQGMRTLGVAARIVDDHEKFGHDSEQDMTFLGFIVLNDPLKKGTQEVVQDLKKNGVTLKVITGDNQLIARNLGMEMGIAEPQIITGSDLHRMSDSALRSKAPHTDIFAEVEPNQKERIILALKKTGNVVGYMGDGINDASALHAADVGISVDSAVDVAKEAADIVLMEKNLEVLKQGIQLGRTTFSNTQKYVFMATSANFGNMFSMAGASLFLKFLPLLPKQILLMNLMTDFPEMNIASDSVDKEMVMTPKRWDIKFIRRFMITFGLISSIFDYLTFGLLILILHASADEFRTGWFIESVVSASLIVLVVRTRRPFYKSKPGKALFISTLIIAAITIIFPFTPAAGMFGFGNLPLKFIPWLVLIILLYVMTAEITKHFFYKRKWK